MTHDGIIHCGTAGNPLGERTIKIYQGSVLDWATRLKPEGFEAFNIKPSKIARAHDIYNSGYYKLIEYLEKIGVPYQHHSPHAENLEPPHEH